MADDWTVDALRDHVEIRVKDVQAQQRIGELEADTPDAEREA